MQSPSHLIAVETYGSQRVRAPASGAMVSAYKIGYSTVGRAVLLALYGSSALDVTSKHASYHYVSLEGDVSAHSGYLLLALIENEFERVKQITRVHPSRRTGIFWWHENQWWHFPHTGDPEFSLSASRTGPNIDPTRYRVVSPSSGEKITPVEGIRAEYSQRSPHEPGWWWLTGDTYPHRDLLKSYGCRWSKKRSAWYFQGATLPAAVQALINLPHHSTDPAVNTVSREAVSSAEMGAEQRLSTSLASQISDESPARNIPLSLPTPASPPIPMDEPAQPPAIRILSPAALPPDDCELDAVQMAIRQAQQKPLQPLTASGPRSLRTRQTISQAYCGELTGSITGQVYAYGFAAHQQVLLYLNLGGPRMAVEAIRAKLSKGETISLVPPDAPALELSAGETEGKANTGMYTAYIHSLPEAKFTSAILVHECITQPNYLGKSTTGIFRTSDEQAIAKLIFHVRQLVNIPVFEDWSRYLYQAGQIAGLIRKPAPHGGGIDLLMVELDRDDWTRLITGGLANGVITLPQMAVE